MDCIASRTMKPHHLILIGLAFGPLVFAPLGWFVRKEFEAPCPVPPPVDARVQWKVDSMARIQADIERKLDSIRDGRPVTARVREQQKISASLELDTIVNDLMKDPE